MMKATSLDSLIDKHIGEIGTPKRDDFEIKWKAKIKKTYKKKK